MNWKDVERQPGESMAHFLAEMRRLRAQYCRIDPDTKISDKAWAQKLLQKASLSRRERHDCFYAAGAKYDSLEIEKALRVRCGRIHEEERRSTSYKSAKPSWESSGREEKTHFKPRKFAKKKPHHTHVAEEAHGDEAEERGDEEEQEEEGLSPVEEEDRADDAVASEEDDEADEMEDEELKEAFAAGWKAKQKTAFARKNRGWKSDNKENKGHDGQKSLDARKKVTTCSSCDNWDTGVETVHARMSRMEEMHHTRRQRQSTSPTWWVVGGVPCVAKACPPRPISVPTAVRLPMRGHQMPV